ncbi:putative endochitinase chi3 [Podospora fimiseda]|uniref:chitinase n=1 Tax=Podospora fimiseda TaxID=252190 RepID=A0AAN6YNV3_9PEZI|nr:putative endochitinase chi3 [Podospora fimiseda]
MAFFGQTHQNFAKDLSEVCDNPNFDIITLAFITNLNPPKLNMAKDTSQPSEAQTKAGFPELMDGTFTPDGKQSVADQIKGCQGKGKKIMLSFGGDERFSNATFDSADEAKSAADNAWNLYFGGTEMQDIRPFGKDLILDGLDLDNENEKGTFYNEFVTEVRSKMDSDSSREYLISANPMAGVLSREEDFIPRSVFSMLDFISVQFYNNPDQGIGGSKFEETIKAWAGVVADAKRPKLFLGIPGPFKDEGNGGAAGSNIQSADQIKTTIESVKGMNLPGFGGVGIWDAAYAMGDEKFPLAVKTGLGAAEEVAPVGKALTDSIKRGIFGRGLW